MALGLITGAIGLVSGGIQSLVGIGQNRKANRLEQQNVFPTTSVNQNIQQNVANANMGAALGIPAAQYNLALQNINRNQAGALRSQERSGRPQSLASLVRAGNDATLQLDAQNAQTRIANQRYADQARLNLAQEEQRVFNWNEAQPYLRNLDRISQLRGAANQNIFGGIGTALNTGLSIFGTQALQGMGGQSGNPATGLGYSPRQQMQFGIGGANPYYGGMNA